QNKNVRTGARVLSVVPAIVAFFMLKPGQFESDPYNLSTSQFIGLLSALIVAYFYAKLWEDARKNPKQAMSLGLADEKQKSKKKASPSPRDGLQETCAPGDQRRLPMKIPSGLTFFWAFLFVSLVSASAFADKVAVLPFLGNATKEQLDAARTATSGAAISK